MSHRTIAALATAPFPSGLAVVRVSGPKAKKVLPLMFEASRQPLAFPRELILGWLKHPETHEKLDQALAVFMPKPHSFSGEDTLEFQMHGSPTLVEKVLKAVYCAGAEPAEAGEFSRQAFLNGKMDLVQAEAVCELASATSDHALQIAKDNLEGALSSAISKVAEPLRDILAEIEATLDFPEEGISPKAQSAIVGTLQSVQHSVAQLAHSFEFGSRVRDGLRVLIAGRPNAGKSSLLNALLGRERAITSEFAGTTRDFIEEELSLSGYRFVFCDSAGLHDTQDPIEKLGIELAVGKLDWADVVLLVADASESDDTWQKALQLIRSRARNIWFVVNKIDLNPQAIGVLQCDSNICSRNFYISAQSRAGTDELLAALKAEIDRAVPDRGHSNIVVTNARHFHCLQRASDAVGSALDSLQSGRPLEIASAEIRIALVALEEIVGKTYTEDILGRIFSKFCIGK